MTYKNNPYEKSKVPIPLRRCKLREDIFNTLVEKMEKRIQVTDHINDYVYGYDNKKTIMLSIKGDEMVIQEYLVNYLLKDKMPECTMWKQIVCIKAEKQEKEIDKDITGLYAYNYMMKLFRKYYSKEKIENILCSYTTKYDEKKAQFHYNIPVPLDTVVRHENCFYYDLNSAYGFMLKEVFPKAAGAIQKLYDGRKENSNNKLFMNYFIGFCKKRGYDGFYNYVVQSISKRLLDSIRKSGGRLIYANTDGYIVSNPTNLIETSKTMGDFKLEYQGTVYQYQCKNYTCYQYGKKTVGNVRICVRDKVKLREGRVVDYDLVPRDIKGCKWISVENTKERIVK